jgi:hypothetical protein
MASSKDDATQRQAWADTGQVTGCSRSSKIYDRDYAG